MRNKVIEKLADEMNERMQRGLPVKGDMNLTPDIIFLGLFPCEL